MKRTCTESAFCWKAPDPESIRFLSAIGIAILIFSLLSFVKLDSLKDKAKSIQAAHQQHLLATPQDAQIRVTNIDLLTATLPEADFLLDSPLDDCAQTVQLAAKSAENEMNLYLWSIKPHTRSQYAIQYEEVPFPPIDREQSIEVKGVFPPAAPLQSVPTLPNKRPFTTTLSSADNLTIPAHYEAPPVDLLPSDHNNITYEIKVAQNGQVLSAYPLTPNLRAPKLTQWVKNMVLPPQKNTLRTQIHIKRERKS